jgi:hypothetical protein
MFPIASRSCFGRKHAGWKPTEEKKRLKHQKIGFYHGFYHKKSAHPKDLGSKKKVVSFPTTYWSVPSVPAKLGHWGSQTVNGTSMVSWVKCSDPKHGDIWRYDKYREKLRKKIWIRYIPLYYIIYYTIYIL